MQIKIKCSKTSRDGIIPNEGKILIVERRIEAMRTVKVSERLP
jgi:hypothetical protein